MLYLFDTKMHPASILWLPNDSTVFLQFFFTHIPNLGLYHIPHRDFFGSGTISAQTRAILGKLLGF